MNHHLVRALVLAARPENDLRKKVITRPDVTVAMKKGLIFSLAT